MRSAVDQQTGRLRPITAGFAGDRQGRFLLVPEQAYPIPPGRRHIGLVVPADAWVGTDRGTPVTESLH